MPTGKTSDRNWQAAVSYRPQEFAADRAMPTSAGNVAPLQNLATERRSDAPATTIQTTEIVICHGQPEKKWR